MATTSITIDEQARALAAAVVTERRCFEALGAAAAAATDPALKLVLATIGRHHGEHALALEVLLPATRDHDPVALLAAADGPATSELGDGGEGPAALLDAAMAEHEVLVARLSPVADGPALRALAAVLAEERADRALLP